MGDMTLTGIPKLGFGLMRLPKLEDGTIDVEQVKTMVDLFLGAGQKYFDTAYVYDGGESEKAAKKALVDRYPRESYYLTTKLNASLPDLTEEKAKQQFYTSLERTGAGYFDFYLLHALQQNNYKKYEEFHLWEFVKELKAKGLIRHYGFSFHSSPELLEQLLTEHPDVDLIQLQVNYADLDNPDVQARKNIEVAVKHGVPYTIMEPVKGGGLAELSPEAEAIFKKVHPDSSMASWAVRFAASQANVITVLSGMSNIGQMKDNLSYMEDFHPLNEEELEAVEQVRAVLAKIESVPCTACHYCTDGCPVQMQIPDIFKAMNMRLQNRRTYAQALEAYNKATQQAKASECIQCGQCEGACPQSIPIIERLRQAAEMFE